MTKKGKNLLIWKGHVTMTKNMRIEVTKCSSKNILQHLFTKKSLLSATSILSRLRMGYNTIASLDKLTFTDYLDFGKCQDRFGQISWSKKDSNYLDVKLKVFKKADNKEIRLFQILTMGEADFNQF